MKVFRKIPAVAALFGAALFPRIADAQSPGPPETTFTITEPTEIPGKVLEPGTYVVKITGNQPDWNIVTFETAVGRERVATVMATPHTIRDAPPDAVLDYFRLPAGHTKALRSWFPVGEPDGEDFVYSKERGEELARLANQPPATEMMAQASAPETPAPREEAREETREETKAEESVAQITPQESPSSTPPNDMTPQPESTTAEVATTRASELPRTASALPLLALMGASALGLGFAVRRLAA